MISLLLMLLTQAPQVLVLTEREVFDYDSERPSWGVLALHFTVPTRTRALRVHFLQRLDGMQVELRGRDGLGRNIPLQAERRFVTDTLNLQWNAEGVREVTIILHHHLRSAPVVADWACGQWQAAPRVTR